MYVHAYICVLVCAYVYVHMSMGVWMCVRMYNVHMYVHMWVYDTNVCMHIHGLYCNDTYICIFVSFHPDIPSFVVQRNLIVVVPLLRDQLESGTGKRWSLVRGRLTWGIYVHSFIYAFVHL